MPRRRRAARLLAVALVLALTSVALEASSGAPQGPSGDSFSAATALKGARTAPRVSRQVASLPVASAPAASLVRDARACFVPESAADSRLDRPAFLPLRV